MAMGSKFAAFVGGVWQTYFPATVSLGASSAGQVVGLNSSGLIDTTMLPGPTEAQILAIFLALPTTLPSGAGQLWNNGGVISIS